MFLSGLTAPVLGQSMTVEPEALLRIPLADIGGGVYWQQLRIELAFDDAPSSETLAIDLPTGVVLNDADGDGALFDEVRVVYQAAGGELPRFRTATVTSSSRIVLESQERAAAGGVIYVQFPTRTTVSPVTSTASYRSLTFADPRETDLDEASLPSLTLVGSDTFAATGSMGIVDLAAPLAAGEDTSTTARGTSYPSQAETLVLALPDLVFDAGLASPNVRAGHGDGDDGNDTHYSFFFSADALNFVDAEVATPARRLTADGSTLYSETEGEGQAVRLLTRDLDAGSYWLYVTSDVTGGVPLARSRVLVVRHEPIIERLGPSGTEPLIFDSGGLLDTAGTANAMGHRRMTLELDVVDHDDDAIVHLFYSGNPNLGPGQVTISGETALLEGATAITISAGLAEETRRVDWDIVGPPAVPAGDYYIYAIAAGGGQSTIDRTTRQIQVRHSPFLRLDATVDGGVADTIITGGLRPQRFTTLTWGRNGPGGDADVDDDATIDLYLSSRTDFAVPTGAAALEEAAAAGDEGTFLITTGLSEDADGRAADQHIWDLWALEGSSVPAAGTSYAVYAVVADNETRRLVRMDGGRPGDAGSTLMFQHPPTIRPLQPVADLNLSSNNTARVSWQDMDLDDDARIRIVLSAEDHGAVSNYDEVTAGLAFVVNSADGRALPEVDTTFDISEDSSVDEYDVGITHLQRGLNADGAPQPGSYTAYLAIAERDTFDSRATAWRVHGRLNVTEPAQVSEAQAPFELFPQAFTIGDDGGRQRMDIVVDAAQETVDLVVLTLRLDATLFTAADTDTSREGIQPFVVADGFSKSKLVTNTTSVDESGSLFLTLEYFDPVPSGIAGLNGSAPLAHFDLVALSGAGSQPIRLINDADGHNSQLERDGAVLQAPATVDLSTALLVEGRAAVGGRVILEGRSDRAATVDVALRNWGAYEDIEDSVFAQSNDVDEESPGVQLSLDPEGDFTLIDVPAGRFDLHIRRAGYLDARAVGLELFPGALVGGLAPSTSDAPGDSLMLGGDVAGYSDPSGVSLPDNEVTLADWDFIASLFDHQVEADDDSARADISGDGTVNIRDLSLVGANFRAQGPRPVYRRNGTDDATLRLELTQSTADTMVARLFVDGLHALHSVQADLRFDATHWQLLQADGAARSLRLAHAKSGLSTVASTSIGAVGLDLRQPVGTWRLAPRVGAPTALQLGDVLLLDGTHTQIGSLRPTDVAATTTVPTTLSLQPNYPNPFNPTTTIRFTIPSGGGHARLDVFDLLGQRIRTLVHGHVAAGGHHVVWDGRDAFGRDVASGTYFARLSTPVGRRVQSMVLLR